jgi:hypothetical protein
MDQYYCVLDDFDEKDNAYKQALAAERQDANVEEE